MVSREQRIPVSELPKSRETLPFKDQLEKVYKQMFPEGFEAKKIVEQEKMGEEVSRVEAEIDDKDVLAILKEYGVNPDLVEDIGEGLFRVGVKNHFSERRLPQGYGYKGGAARALLLRSLEIDSTHQPRDIDVVRLSPKEPYEGADYEVAREFMPEDFAHGDGG